MPNEPAVPESGPHELEQIAMDRIHIVLASASPRRQGLLAELGLAFSIRTERVDEAILPGESPADLVARLSRIKAGAVPLQENEVVVAADTVVALDDAVLGKPLNADDARRMLLALRDRPHLVHTGLSVGRPGHIRTETVTTLVFMRPYSTGDIEAYIASGQPMDKAGAYGIQNQPFAPVSRVEGCYMTVMGLPLCHVARGLLRWGIEVPRLPPEYCHSVLGTPCRVALF
jgi:septum formation protein